MKGLLQLVGIILGGFFFLGILPVVFPPSVFVVYPVAGILGYYLLRKNYPNDNCL